MAETTTKKATRRISIATLQRHIASQMSNVLFNLAQRRETDSTEARIMRELVREWDAIKSAHRRKRG